MPFQAFTAITQCKSSLFSLHQACKQGQGQTAVHMLWNVRDALDGYTAHLYAAGVLGNV